MQFNTDHNAHSIKAAPAVVKLRLDHTDLSQYYTATGSLLQSLLPSLNDAEDNLSCSTDGAPGYVEQIYDKIINILRNSADSFIPKHKANFYKFWWDQELNELKANSAQIMFGRLQANLTQDRYLCNAKRLKLLTSVAYAKHLKRKK